MAKDNRKSSPRRGRPQGSTKAAIARKKQAHRSAPEAPEEGRHATPVSLKLPLAYLEIIEQEARHFGVRKGTFLTMLLKRRHGELQFDRPRSATRYVFDDQQLRESKLWIWYMPPGTRELLDADRLQMGLNTIGGWITQVINRWVGHPEGLRRP